MKPTGVLAWGGAIGFLLVYEWWALASGHQTLSRAALILSTAWPPLIFVTGLVVGGLVVHVWWRWNPEQSTKGGG